MEISVHAVLSNYTNRYNFHIHDGKSNQHYKAVTKKNFLVYQHYKVYIIFLCYEKIIYDGRNRYVEQCFCYYNNSLPLKKWLARKQYHTGKIGTFGVVAVHSIRWWSRYEENTTKVRKLDNFYIYRQVRTKI